ncbi:MAG: hypothetical protein ABJH82_08640 [Polaribacter sp.]|uniref:hypothetical protein n=1 Tax=Polaribacter sp. TaxID=1920175 RepID=UPI003297FCBD
MVDKSTGENVFTNNTYESRYIKIINLDDESRVNFSFLDEDDYNILMISSIGWQTEIINCSIKIDNNEIFTLYVDADRLSEDCCSYTKYNEIKIDNTGYTYNQENGIYTILIE